VPQGVQEKKVAREKRLCEALMRGCEAGKVSVTDVDCGRVAQEIEKSLYSLHNENCGEQYKLKYRSLVDNIKYVDGLELSRKLMEGILSPCKVYIVLIVFPQSLVLFVGYNVYFFINVLVLFIYSADDLVKIDMCKPDSKKMADARQKQDEHTMDHMVKNETSTLILQSAFPVAVKNHKMRPDSEPASDGQRPASHHNVRELSAAEAKAYLTLSPTGKGNL
jgi:hypothetical protein